MRSRIRHGTYTSAETFGYRPSRRRAWVDRATIGRPGPPGPAVALAAFAVLVVLSLLVR